MSRICLYCKLSGEPSREHVVPASLGGNLTIPFVCKACNTNFSGIDQALAERSMVALTRILETPTSKRVSLPEVIWTDHPHTPLDSRLINRFSLEQMPYLSLLGAGKIECSASDSTTLRKFFDTVDRVRESGQLRQTHIRIDLERKFALLVQYRTAAIRVIAPDCESGKVLLRYVDEQWPKIRQSFARTVPRIVQYENPRISLRLAVDINGSHRAIAKIALNLLAYHRGVDFALRDSFDDVREYIRGNNLVLPVVGPEGIAVDQRFVDAFFESEENFLQTSGHMVFFFKLDGLLLAHVILYGRHKFLVRLGRADDGSVDFIAHEFSTDGSSNREVAIFEMYQRAKSSKRDH